MIADNESGLENMVLGGEKQTVDAVKTSSQDFPPKNGNLSQ